MTERPTTFDLDETAPTLAAARDEWWTRWDEANLQPNGRSGLGIDIEAGWDAAWDCVAQAIAQHDAEVAAKALQSRELHHFESEQAMEEALAAIRNGEHGRAEHIVGVAYGVQPTTGHSYRFASCRCGWAGPNRRTHERAQQDAESHAKKMRPRWRVAADQVHIEKVTPEAEVVETEKTSYGRLENARNAAKFRNRDKEASK